MPHKSISSLVFSGFVPTTAATLISLLGDEGLPGDIHVVEQLVYQPWNNSRSGLLVVSMDPTSDLAKISKLIQDRTTWWEVAVCLSDSISAYQPALLAQGAIKVLPHPEDDLTGARDELRDLLKIITVSGTDLLGLEVSDLIQLYAEKRVPKTIRISGDGVIGSMFLRDGNIVHVETMDEDEGMMAFSRLFRVKSPEIRVHNGCLTSKNSLNMPAMSALLEGARVNDEDSRGDNAEPLPNSSELANAVGDILDDFDVGSSGDSYKKADLDSVDSDLDLDLD